jgi:hypothetical protein
VVTSLQPAHLQTHTANTAAHSKQELSSGHLAPPAAASHLQRWPAPLSVLAPCCRWCPLLTGARARSTRGAVGLW